MFEFTVLGYTSFIYINEIKKISSESLYNWGMNTYLGSITDENNEK